MVCSKAKSLDKALTSPNLKACFLTDGTVLWNNASPDEDLRCCAVYKSLTDQFMSPATNGLYVTGLL